MARIPAITRWLLAASLSALPLCAAAMELAMPGGLRLALPVTSLKAMRFAATARQQYDFSCGSAAVATLLSHHYGRPTTEQQVFESMFLHGEQARIRREGFSMLDMQRFLATLGLRADGFKQPLGALLEAGLPAIVLVAEQGFHHFVVIKGMQDGRMLLGDPARGTRAMSQQAFESIWQNKLLFVIHGYQGAVRFNAPGDWQAAPAAPLAQGIDRQALDLATLPKHGPSDF